MDGEQQLASARDRAATLLSRSSAATFEIWRVHGTSVCFGSFRPSVLDLPLLWRSL
jgi:hypothetical protein